MITLNPDVVGSLAPPSKFTYASNQAGTTVGVPFRVLPRVERLRAQGRLVERSVIVENDEPPEDDDEKDRDQSIHKKDIQEKKKMRGKNKTLKRYLRKKRKNIVDNSVVCLYIVFFFSLRSRLFPA